MNEFTDKNNKYAIIGVSDDTSKWGRKVFDKMLDSGYNVVPVNPKYDEIGESKCFHSLKEIPVIPEIVITIVPPKVTENVVKACNDLGIKNIWMQEGSESDEAIKFCKENDINCIHGACFIVDGMKTKF